MCTQVKNAGEWNEACGKVQRSLWNVLISFLKLALLPVLCQLHSSQKYTWAWLFLLPSVSSLVYHDYWRLAGQACPDSSSRLMCWLIRFPDIQAILPMFGPLWPYRACTVRETHLKVRPGCPLWFECKNWGPKARQEFELVMNGQCFIHMNLKYVFFKSNA